MTISVTSTTETEPSWTPRDFLGSSTWVPVLPSDGLEVVGVFTGLYQSLLSSHTYLTLLYYSPFTSYYISTPTGFYPQVGTGRELYPSFLDLFLIHSFLGLYLFYFPSDVRTSQTILIKRTLKSSSFLSSSLSLLSEFRTLPTFCFIFVF